jgi:hypothetical protein
VPPRPVERACGARLAAPHGRCAATTRAPDTPLDAVALNPPPTGCLGGTNPISRRTSTLSRKLTNQSSRADTQSKISAAS